MASAPSASATSPAARPWCYETPEDTPPDLAAVERIAQAPIRASRHVFAVHCETTCGILNPIEAIGAIWPPPRQAPPHRRHERLRRAAARCRARSPFDAVAASSNKCIEGVPGLGFVICPQSGAGRDQGQRDDAGARPARPVAATSRRPASTASRRRSTSSSPSIRRCEEFWAEGGVAGRGGRYAENCSVLIEGMRALGFETLLPDAPAGADHRHLPHAGRSELRLPALL